MSPSSEVYKIAQAGKRPNTGLAENERIARANKKSPRREHERMEQTKRGFKAWGTDESRGGRLWV